MDSTALHGPLAQRGIGVVAPFDLALDRELWRFVPPGVSLHLARTPYEPVSVSMEMAELVSDGPQVAAATRDVLAVEPELVAYLCASGSFIHGVAGERELRGSMISAGAPDAVTTSGALTDALETLAVTKVCVVAPYRADLTAKLNEFLAELGVGVLASEHLGLDGGIWKVSYRTVAERILSVDRAGAEAIFVSCTNLPTYDLIEPLERELGKPILTANQVTMWSCLRRMGLPTLGPGGWLTNVAAEELVEIEALSVVAPISPAVSIVDNPGAENSLGDLHGHSRDHLSGARG